jgi:2,4-dienoyl-CoA reductase-like NADH-dependent reductase (Old Yellow Enzyme family)
MTSALFSPLDLGPATLANRIAVAPMCMYSSDDGSASDWHIQHWSQLAISGAAMITFEATGVERRGRITHRCLGLYSDANEAALAAKLAVARRWAAPGTQFGIQLAHAGRKASTQVPWLGGGALGKDEDPWQTVGPSAIPFAPGWHVPEALDGAGIEALVQHFAAAAKRAERAGLDFVEIHGAHGYLLHEFLSPLSNKRTDRYGGSLENRMRLVVEVTKAVRAALPARMFVGVRLSASEWTQGGFEVDEAVEVSAALKEAGAVYICASSGGNAHNAQIPVKPLYQAHLAEAIHRRAGIATRAVGLITMPAEAEALIAEDRTDMVALARAILADPRWPWRAAAELGETLPIVGPYQRSWPTMRHWAPAG